MRVDIRHGDCLEVLAGLPDDSVDSCVTDPPYGLRFMGKAWDCSVPGVEVWREVLRVLKPGGHLLAFAGTRTQHRMAVAIEDAGFEIRDLIAWVYGSGFPKSHNLSGEWQGWGTALKPALEPITVARKPLVGTVAENVQARGTGGINVDGCRVETDATDLQNMQGRSCVRTAPHLLKGMPATSWEPTAKGRWPANLIHDGSEEVLAGFPESKDGVAGKRSGTSTITAVGLAGYSETWGGFGGAGSAARFFYCAKASRADREEGLGGFEPRETSLKYSGGDGFAGRTMVDGEWVNTDPANRKKPRNHHPTVKPTDLMRYLCRLVTPPPGGLVLDPFMGSGSTGKAAVLEGFRFLGIEREAEYCEIARARIAAAIGDQLPLERSA